MGNDTLAQPAVATLPSFEVGGTQLDSADHLQGHDTFDVNAEFEGIIEASGLDMQEDVSAISSASPETTHDHGHEHDHGHKHGHAHGHEHKHSSEVLHDHHNCTDANCTHHSHHEADAEADHKFHKHHAEAEHKHHHHTHKHNHSHKHEHDHGHAHKHEHKHGTEVLHDHVCDANCEHHHHHHADAVAEKLVTRDLKQAEAETTHNHAPEYDQTHQNITEATKGYIVAQGIDNYREPEAINVVTSTQAEAVASGNTINVEVASPTETTSERSDPEPSTANFIEGAVVTIERSEPAPEVANVENIVVKQEAQEAAGDVSEQISTEIAVTSSEKPAETDNPIASFTETIAPDAEASFTIPVETTYEGGTTQIYENASTDKAEASELWAPAEVSQEAVDELLNIDFSEIIVPELAESIQLQTASEIEQPVIETISYDAETDTTEVQLHHVETVPAADVINNESVTSYEDAAEVITAILDQYLTNHLEAVMNSGQAEVLQTLFAKLEALQSGDTLNEAALAETVKTLIVMLEAAGLEDPEKVLKHYLKIYGRTFMRQLLYDIKQIERKVYIEQSLFAQSTQDDNDDNQVVKLGKAIINLFRRRHGTTLSTDPSVAG